MSRSYKKNPYIKDGSAKAKRFANKKVRRYKEDIPDGKFYRKIFDPYNISDWSYGMSWNEYWKTELANWKKREEELALFGFYYIGYHSYKRGNPVFWMEENPELHKRKHYGFWKSRYLSK